jgi:NAD-dependent deacetylase
MNEHRAALTDVFHKADNIVFFGGAGVSTESNIPDFRSAGGLYGGQGQGGYRVEEMLSHSFFMRHTETFYDFYRNKMIYRDAKPNAAHLALVTLERMGKLRAVITQNIDGLHQAAGSQTVLELHGSVHRNRCMSCGKSYDLAHVLKAQGVPRCDDCGGVVKPDVVLYEEYLDPAVTEAAAGYIAEAEVLIVGGTSLAVYPAANLVSAFRGGQLVLINKTPTPQDHRATLVIHGRIGDVLGDAVAQMENDETGSAGDRA